MSETQRPTTTVQRTFADRYCEVFQCSREQYESHLLTRVLSVRLRVLSWVGLQFSPSMLHAERNVVRQAGYAYRIADVQGVIEFYRHKFVNGDWYRETFGFRLSGKKLLQIARQVDQSSDAFEQVVTE